MTAVLTMTSSDGRRLVRYPFGPVEELVGRRTGLKAHCEPCPCHDQQIQRDGYQCVSAGLLALVLGTSERQVYRWRAAGLKPAVADRLASELNLRIEDLWDED